MLKHYYLEFGEVCFGMTNQENLISQNYHNYQFITLTFRGLSIMNFFSISTHIVFKTFLSHLKELIFLSHIGEILIYEFSAHREENVK